eukprot:TRINITY_DN4701_c0_g1_i1.p1 TRINITY_DN4701_c0_g1~~TRINITY_DN4701_c0_g1_i1.p1  ORF type:complete len:662 (-),score=125.68 TRINITY_DN4701_c0_g1_i1:241-2007(-)
MDTIEISNLNRQFLYRSQDVGKSKAEVSARAVKSMNPHMNLEHWLVRVGPDTESTYDDLFFSRLDVVCNALDNVQARLYMDSRCVFARKPLLESGTLGTKGNTQVVVPGLTESYGSSVDPPALETPVCLLHTFPNNIQHCLQWARELMFEGYFVHEPEINNNYLSQGQEFLDTLTPTKRMSTLVTLERTVLLRPRSFSDCVEWARCLFEERFTCLIQQLLHNFPIDYTDQHGAPFWSGAKRPPMPLKFDPSDPEHVDFLVSATFLKAYVCGLVGNEYKPQDLAKKREYIINYAKKVNVPIFVPKKVKIITDEKVTKKEEENDQYTDEDEVRCQEILAKLPSAQDCKSDLKMNVVQFEKDDDRNFHIDFIASASNLRARNYNIPTVGRLESKIIAGKIIPAIVTTTATIVGFINLELYKLIALGVVGSGSEVNSRSLEINERKSGELSDKKNTDILEKFRNTFINLGLPVFQQSEPIRAPVRKFAGRDYTLWDRIDVRLGDITLKELIKHFRTQYGVVIDMIGVGASLIYASWMMSKAAERLPKKLTTVVEEVTGKKIPPNLKFLMIDPTITDLEGNDVDDLPPVCYWL